MKRISFPVWLEHRIEEVPDASRLATVIASSGTGISLDALQRSLRIRLDTLTEILAALVATGQVTVLMMNGQRVYRAAM